MIYPKVSKHIFKCHLIRCRKEWKFFHGKFNFFTTLCHSHSSAPFTLENMNQKSGSTLKQINENFSRLIKNAICNIKFYYLKRQYCIKNDFFVFTFLNDTSEKPEFQEFPDNSNVLTTFSTYSFFLY